MEKNVEAFDVLLPYLTNSSSRIRAEAADAIKEIALEIGDNALNSYHERDAVGAFLLGRFVRSESEEGVRSTLALGLGALKYQKAVPALIEALSSPSSVVRGCVAWSLGHLRSKEALYHLTLTLLSDKDKDVKRRINEATTKISNS